jgi:hypothetical protein
VLTFRPVPSPFAAYGDRMWLGLAHGRYSFVITFTTGLGYTATWKDAYAPPSQAIVLVDGASGFGDALVSCAKQARALAAEIAGMSPQ